MRVVQRTTRQLLKRTHKYLFENRYFEIPYFMSNVVLKKAKKFHTSSVLSTDTVPIFGGVVTGGGRNRLRRWERVPALRRRVKEPPQTFSVFEQVSMRVDSLSTISRCTVWIKKKKKICYRVRTISVLFECAAST